MLKVVGHVNKNIF